MGGNMSKVLYIKACARGDEYSTSLRVANEFVKQYELSNPNDEVEVLDLYDAGIDFLSSELLSLVMSGADNVAKEHALKFASFDKYVIAEPMWNLGVPAILKAYLDYVCYAGISFKYTQNGPQGLLLDKKAVNINSTGGAYQSEPAKSFEHCNSYLQSIFGFMGVVDYTTVSLEHTGMYQGDALEVEIEKAVAHAVEVAKTF